MTNEEQKLRELVERWMGKKHPITMQSYVSDLTALISEGYYPKEFVEWTMMQGIMGIYDRKGYLYSSALLNLKGFKGDNTIKNLFNYWKENVRC
jgi:hypothetical protein